jgi:hypothetical protein
MILIQFLILRKRKQSLWQDTTAHNTVSCGNLFVMVFAAPYLANLVNVYKSQSSNNLHHSTAIALPAAHDFANTAPYQLATVTVPQPNGTIHRPVSCAGNTNYHNCRAVSIQA